jgi:hypothetical protein
VNDESGRIEFLGHVRVDILSKYGGDAACVYAYLCFVARRKPKDGHGYFTMDSAFAARALGITRQRFIRSRDKLAMGELVDYIEGRNQNCKPRYKLL